MGETNDRKGDQPNKALVPRCGLRPQANASLNKELCEDGNGTFKSWETSIQVVQISKSNEIFV